MRTRAASDDDIQEAFDKWAEGPFQYVPTDAGFDTRVQAAMLDYIDQPTKEAMSRAKAELRGQLNGGHAKLEDEAWAQSLREEDIRA